MSPFVRIGLTAGVPYTLLMCLWLVLIERDSIWVAAISAAAGGIVFSVLFAAFTYSEHIRRQATPVFGPGEDTVKEGVASHWRGLGSVGGRLFLTGQRLVFKSHRYNIRREELSLPLDHIAEARLCMTARVIPNGLQVEAKDGQVERFVVEDRREWAAQIMTAVQRYTSCGQA